MTLYFSEFLYFISMLDIVGFIVLSLLFSRIKDQYATLLCLLFMASALVNVAATNAVVTLSHGEVPVSVIVYATARLTRVTMQWVVIYYTLGTVRSTGHGKRRKHDESNHD